MTVVASVGRAKGRRELGRSTRRLASRADATVVIQLGARARRAVRSARVRLAITAIDAAGNRVATRRSVTVRGR